MQMRRSAFRMVLDDERARQRRRVGSSDRRPFKLFFLNNKRVHMVEIDGVNVNGVILGIIITLQTVLMVFACVVWWTNRRASRRVVDAITL